MTSTPVKEYVVRILAPSGVKGAGYLVTDKHVLSCAHVVASALGVPDTQPNPPDAAAHSDSDAHWRLRERTQAEQPADGPRWKEGDSAASDSQVGWTTRRPLM